MKVARVFPRRTKATPIDEDAYIDGPDMWIRERGYEEIHISVTFTWDLPRAEWLAKQWEGIAPVKMGGPALGTKGEDFTPGMYLKPGYVITSRGCPNRCWHCSVWRRDGATRELTITEGNKLQDDNILACSEGHIRAVVKMLRSQRHVEFTGGLEASRLSRWHIELIEDLKIEQIFMAYDTPDDWEPLVEAKKLFSGSRLDTKRYLRCYVLIGGPGDTLKNAEARLNQVLGLGIYPMAMLYRDGKTGSVRDGWSALQKTWARPAIIFHKLGARNGKTGKAS